MQTHTAETHMQSGPYNVIILRDLTTSFNPGFDLAYNKQGHIDENREGGILPSPVTFFFTFICVPVVEKNTGFPITYCLQCHKEGQLKAEKHYGNRQRKLTHSKRICCSHSFVHFHYIQAQERDSLCLN